MLQTEGAHEPVKVEFDNFEHGFPEGFGPGGWGHLAYAIGIAFAAFQLVIAAWNILPSQVVRGVHVGFLILMTFGLIGNFTAKSNAGRAAGLADRQRRISVRALPVDLLRRPDRARRRSDPARSHRRHAAGGPDLRGHAAADGAGAAADVRRLPAVLVLRPVSAGAAQSSRLRFRSGHHASVLRHRRLLRRADLRLGDLHLPVHPVRLVPRARRHDPAVHRRVARPVRRHPRRSGQGRGVRLGHDGHDFRLRRRQCRHRRPVHDSADDQVRLPPRLRRRRRGHRLDGRADHAAGDGRGRLHHGGDAGRRLLGDRQGRRYSGDAVFRLRVLDGASGSRQARPRRHEALGNSERLEGAGGALVSGVAAGGPGLHAVRRLYAALRRHHGAVADGGADPRRQHHARLLLKRAALYLLGRPRAGGGRGIAQRPRYCADRLHHRSAGADLSRSRAAAAPRWRRAAIRSPTAPSRRSPSAWPAPSSAPSSA